MTSAKEMAEIAQQKVNHCLSEKKSFILEAGAGAGKTYALIESIQFLIKQYEKEYKRNGKKIACITYTNRAKENIEKQIRYNTIISVDTIHGFFWSVIKQFQKELKKCVIESENWQQRWQDKYKGTDDIDLPQSRDLENIGDYAIQYTLMANRVIDSKIKL